MRIARALASLGPVGRAGPAPGTVASAVAVVAGAALMRASPRALWLAALLSLPVGWASVRRTAGADEDPGWIVIDELAGQWIAMLGLRGPGIAGLLASFAAFRALDILKPGPVGWADRRRGALGVMGDDAVAGALAACILVTLRMARRAGRR